jgi:DNA modification methylase
MVENMNKIYNEDNLIGMNRLISTGLNVDLIVADPPYVISKDSQFHTMKDRKNPRTGTNFGGWDQEFDNKLWLRRAFKLLKNGGSLIVFNDFKKASFIIYYAQKLGFIYKDTLVWRKTNPMPRNRDRRYVPALEMMIWFVKPGDKWTFNRMHETYESGVFAYASESGGAFNRIHPTQKPVKLIEQLIRIHSDEGDLVLDPFMGSGCTAIACINSGREYIGFELDKDYYDKSIIRIESLPNE